LHKKNSFLNVIIIVTVALSLNVTDTGPLRHQVQGHLTLGCVDHWGKTGSCMSRSVERMCEVSFQLQKNVEALCSTIGGQ